MAESIVITGGNGFVGRHLVTHLLQAAPDVHVVVWDKHVANVAPPAEGVVVDISNPETYQQHLAALQPTWVVHLAAQSSVSGSFQDPDTTQRLNVAATKQLLETLVEESPATKVLAVSSADIYGAYQTPNAAPLPELPLAVAQPVNPYGQSKLAMEAMIEQLFNDRVIRVRPFPHIGPGQRPGFVAADFASQIAAIETGKQSPIISVGNLTAVRDFTDVRDVVRAYALLLQRGAVGEVYHVASGSGVTIRDLLNHLIALSATSITIKPDEQRLRPVDIPYLVGDATKLHAATGWQPTIPLSQTLRDVLNDWRERTAR